MATVTAIMGTATVTGIMVTIMGMIGMAITVIAITGMIGLMVGAMGIAMIGTMIAGPDGLTVAVMVLVGIRGTERMPGQGTAIRPTNVSTHATDGIRALAIRIPAASRSRWTLGPLKSQIASRPPNLMTDLSWAPPQETTFRGQSLSRAYSHPCRCTCSPPPLG